MKNKILTESTVSLETIMNKVQKRAFAKTFIAILISMFSSLLVPILHIPISPIIYIICVVIEIGLAMFLSMAIEKASALTCYVALAVEATVTGLTVGIFLQRFNPLMAMAAFAISAMFFAVMSLIGFITEKNLNRLGAVCFGALITLIIAEIILGLIGMPLPVMLTSAISLAIFAGLTAYDSQKVRELPTRFENSNERRILENYSTYLALSLYLDFVNIFIDMLSLMGSSSDN